MHQDQHDDWNPLNTTILTDQRQAYDEMRERCPVAHSEFMGWSLFRHDDVATVLADPTTYSNVSRYQAIPNGIDPPMHGRHRGALDVFFNHEHMEMLAPRAREIAVNLLTPMLSGSKAELIETFARPFALKTLCAFLGWPDRHWECLGGWTHDSQLAAFNRDANAGKALASLFSEHVKANLASHRASANSASDATDLLLQTEIDGVPLDDDQIVSVLRNWTAGHGTVVAGLSILVLYLAQDPELQNRLRSNPSLIPAAIEEILRVDGPLVANPRITTRVVEIQGRTIPKGEKVTLMWIAADRDPRAFDDPATVKIERNNDASMVWGKGIHLCQGAPMARLEMQIALEELLARTQRFELAVDAPCRAVYPGNGLNTLPLRFT